MRTVGVTPSYNPFGYGMNGMGVVNNLDGQFEFYNSSIPTITGWATDTTNYKGANQSVDISIDGHYVGTTAANLPDAGTAALGFNNVGFSFPIPLQYQDGNTHTISGVITGTQVTLRNSGNTTFNIKSPYTTTTGIVSPSSGAQINAANSTTASGDTSSTSQATLNNLTAMFSGGVSIAGINIPTWVLLGGAVAVVYMMSSGAHKGRF